MLIYICEPKLTGLLTAFFDCYEKKEVPELVTSQEEYQIGFENEIKMITADEQKAERIEKAVVTRMGNDGFGDIVLAYCSGSENKEMIIFRYLLMVFKFGSKCSSLFNDERIIAFNDIKGAVSYEIHRMKGFIRFKEITKLQMGSNVADNLMYYSPFSPDNNIIEYITEYFFERNKGMFFIIHDLKRGLLGLCDGKDWDIFPAEKNIEISVSENEEMVNHLWKQYFNTVTIASRKNKRLQDHFLPRRYRKYLAEFEF